MEWSQIAAAFVWDGSLRDIYILGATEADWDAMLVILRGFNPPPVFTVDGLVRDLPGHAAEVFTLRKNHSPKLTVMAGKAVLNCHFFCETEIEFDLDPREITGALQAEALAKFIRQLSDITDKSVILCHENSPHLLIASYSPPDEGVIWAGMR